VSEYLLRNYRPVLDSHGFLFMSRRGVVGPSASAVSKGLSEAPLRSSLYFQPPPCDWGFAPNFLSTMPVEGRPSLVVPVRRLADIIRVSGWAADLAAGRPAREIVAAVGSRVIAHVEPALGRVDVAAYLGDARFTYSGFELAFRGAPHRGSLAGVRLYAVLQSGQAAEFPGSALASGDSAGPPTLKLEGGRVLRVSSASTQGHLDAASIDPVRAFALPPKASRYGWLAVETRAPLRRARFQLTDRVEPAPDFQRSILFDARGGESRIRFQVGACSQWYGYASRRLYLLTDTPAEIRAVQLWP
jgi:hypothetical protein